jgi:hypothetical protein
VTSFALNGEVIVGKESVVDDCMLHSGGGNWQYLTNADPSKCFRGAGGFQVDILSPVNNYFYIAISSLTLETIFGVFLGLDINDWPTCVRESGFKDREYVKSVFIVHVGCTRRVLVVYSSCTCRVPSSAENNMKIHARITLTVECIRTCICFFLFEVSLQGQV